MRLPALHPSTDPPSLPDDGSDDEFDGPSKSARKRAMHALQDLGERIVALTPEQTARLDLPERLIDAIELVRTIRAHEGRRRQMQFIGKLMRDVDAERVAAQLDGLVQGHRAEVALQHAAEHWRDRLLKEPSAVTDFAAEQPGADVQRLRQLLRQAARTPDAPRPRRELYRVLLETLRQDDAGASPDDTDEDHDDDDR